VTPLPHNLAFDWSADIMRAFPLAILLVAAPALAVPALLPLEGVLTDANHAPVFGEHTLTFSLYDTQSGGAALHVESVTLTMPAEEKGHFLTALGTTRALDLGLFAGRDALFLGVALDEESEMEPRLALGSVPFAAIAREAETLAGLAPDDLVKVGDAIPFATLTDLPVGLNDGDDVGADVATAPLQLVDGRVSLLPCPSGQILKSLDGAWACDDDVEATGVGFSPGVGLTMNGTTLNIDPAVVQQRVQGACGPGSFVVTVAGDGSLLCGADQNTTYTVANPLVLNGTTIGMTAACAPGQVLKAGAMGTGAWVCSNDIDTFPIAGNGLMAIGASLAVNANAVQSRIAGTCAPGSAVRSIGIDGSVTCELNVDTAPTAGLGVDVVDNAVSVEPDIVDGSRFDGRFPRQLAGGGYVVSSNLMPAPADVAVAGTCDDDLETLVTLPFELTVFGVTSSNITVANNGVVVFDTPTVQDVPFTNTALPSAITQPALYAFWDDLDCDPATGGELRFETKGAAGSRVFYIYQRAIPFLCAGGDLACNVEITIALSEGSNAVTVTYKNSGTEARARGNSATIGLQGPGGASAEFIAVSRDALVLDAAAGQQFVSFAHP
jgi:hypothetical protein